MNLSQFDNGDVDFGAVNSSQRSVHPKLGHHVDRHLQSPWQQPLHKASVDVVQPLLDSAVISDHQSIVLDSGCGTGCSTLELANRYPHSLVIGVDQSEVRLSRNGVSGSYLKRDNCILIRAELSTFWRLLLGSGLSIQRHLLYYPNPWPKPAHLMRRWHGHPVFPALLALGGEIELRCNWEIYAQEFALAAAQVLGLDVGVEPVRAVTGVSPFEKKYHDRQHALFAVRLAAKDTAAFRSACLRGEMNWQA